MSVLPFHARASVRVALVLSSLILSACSYEGLPLLALKQILVTEWPANANSDRRLVVLVELMETGPLSDYPAAPYVWSGFCGEELRVAQIGLGGLYRQRVLSEPWSFDKSQAEPRPDIKPLLFAVINVARPQGLANDPHFPDFDLRHEKRDICLRTSVMTGMFSAQHSNTVKIPRDEIIRALGEGVQPLPPLVSFVDVFPGPKFIAPMPR